MAEIGAQVKANALNASEADQLVTRARDAGSEGINRMEAMTSAMSAISESSAEISKIIKTVDDIAFQTNLLALNAAVEAARAGKHGKGFAVVAQEVRNLAARSAKAAQETGGLIENAVQRVEDGTTIAQKTAISLEEINGAVEGAVDLVKKIASASQEQAESISHVNTGLNQIDKVTQSNTANAEETSAIAADLNAQASIVNNLVSEFKLKDNITRQVDPSEENSKSEYRALPPPEGQWGAA